MKTLFAVTLFLLIVLFSSPAASAQAAVSLTGTWRIAPIGHGVAMTLTLQQDGNKLTGMLGNTPLEGTVEDSKIHFTAKNFQGAPFDYTGTIDSSTYIHGNVTGPQENAPWSATRPAPAATTSSAAPPSGASTTTQHQITTIPATAPAPPVVAATAVSPAPTAPSPSMPGKAYHCVLYAREGAKDIRYSSSPVPTDAPVASLNDAWKDYARATYHINNPHTYGGCQILNGIPANRDREVNSLEENWKRLHAEVIHVDWTSAPGQTATTSNPSPAHPIATGGAAASGHPVTPPAPVVSNSTPAASTPLGADPRLAAIPSRIRGMMNAEATANESGCRNNPAGYARVDCRCFAQKVLDYRIAHASEYQIVYGEADLVGHVVGWAQVPNVVAAAKQSCTQ